MSGFQKARVTKTLLMHEVIHGRQHECFEHSELGLFDITAMRACLAAMSKGEGVTLRTVALEDILQHILESRVFEEERVSLLPTASWASDPGIMIVTAEDTGRGPTVAMVDGHHRALRRAAEGLTDMEFWFIPIALAIRPGPGWVKNPFVEWGDDVVDGKIVRKTR